MFPPGKQVVTPSRADGQEPEELTLTINAATAATLEAARAELQAKADAGEGDAPYFDFNHEDRESAAWPRRIFWAGDDPISGGVRAEVEWSAAGDSAVKGKTFRRFSPVFFAEKGNPPSQPGRITGTTVNMGGLVNRAAFRRIAPLFATDPTPTPSKPTMNEDQIKALQAENADLKTKLDAAQKQLDELTKKDAEATVEQAAKEGRIGTAPELKAKWVDSIIKDPAAAELLMAMAPNPALVTPSVIHPAPAAGDSAPAALLAKYNGLTDRAEKSAFFAKHKEALRTAHDQSIR